MAGKQSLLEHEHGDFDLDGRHEIVVTSRFVDPESGQLMGPGVWPVTESQARRIINTGKGHFPGKSLKTPTAPVTMDDLAELANRAGLSTEDGTLSMPQGGVPLENPGLRVDLRQAEENATANDGGAESAGTDLPERFPSRQLLIQNGFDTVEKVKAATKEQLAAIEGIGEASVQRIGVAASKL